MAWGDGSGGSSGWGGSTGSGWGGSSARSRTGTAAKPRKSTPVKDLGSGLVRLARTMQSLDAGDRARATSTLIKQSAGLPDKEFQRVAMSVPESIRPVLQSKREQSFKTHGAIDSAIDAGESWVGKVFNTVSAPVRYNMSALGEYSRQYEKEGRPFIPTSIDIPKVVNAGIEGAQNKRHDSPLSIAHEAGVARKKHGDSTQAFGGAIPWKNDLRTNPVGGGTAGNIAFDIGGSIALDPLTYISFGLSGPAKAGIRGSTELIGAERTAAMVEGGMKVLSAEEKAQLAEGLAPRVYKALEGGVRGGVKVALPKVPTPSNLSEGRYLGEARTVLPGPLRGLRAAKIIEGTGGRSAEVLSAASSADRAAHDADVLAADYRRAADAAEARGASTAHVKGLHSQAEALDKRAADARSEMEALQKSTRRASGPDVSGPLSSATATDVPPLYHGTSRPVDGGFVAGGGRGADNLFGPGLYSTDRLDTATSYFRKGAGEGVDPTLYHLQWQGTEAPRILDLEAELPAAIRPALNEWVDNALDHLDMSEQTFADIKNAAHHGTGSEFYSAVKRGLGEAHLPTYEADEIVDYLNRDVFHDRGGFDAFRHRGGIRTGSPEHNAYIWLEPEKMAATAAPRGVADPAELARLAKAHSEARAATAQAEALRVEAEATGMTSARATTLRAQADQIDELGAAARVKATEVYGAASKDASTVAERLRDTPVGRALKAVGESKTATTVRGMFIPRDAVRARFGEGVAQMLDDARVRYRGTYQANVEDDVNTLLHAARETGVTNAELEHIIGPALDINGAQHVADIPDELRPMYDALVEVRDRFTNAQVEAGIAREEALHVTDEYFPRILTEQARELQGKKTGVLSPAVPGEANAVRAPSGNLLKRTADVDSPISEINAAAVTETGAPKFEANPLTAFSKRSVAAHQDIATKQYVDDVLKITDASGNPVMRVAREGEAVPAGLEELKIPGAGRVFAPKEIAGEVTKARELLVNDEAMKGFLNGIDHWMTLWKGYATVPLPFGLGFHERNAMGNVFNNWLSGMSPLDGAYGKAQRIQRAMTRGAKEGDVLKYLTAADRKIVQEARHYDVVGEGFFGVDLPKNVSEPVNVPFRSASTSEKVRRVRSAANPLNTDNALIASGRKLGRAIEENARLAHFINKLDEYGSAVEAARSVRKYLFDYADLTATERQVFKRFMAFYTFTRKNMPVQIGAILQTPGKFSHIQSVREGVAENAERPKGLYPGYLPEVGGTPLPMSVSGALAQVPGLRFKKDEQTVYAPDLPLYNATSTMSPAVQLFASLPGVNKIPGLPHNEEGVTGAAKDALNSSISGGAPGALMAAVQAFGAEKDFFSGRPLQGRVAAPLYAKPFADDRVLNGAVQPTITSKSQYLAESLLPILGKLSSAFPQGDYEQEKAPRRRLSTFTGQRVYPLGPGATRGEALRRLTALDRFFDDLRAKGIDIQSSRTKTKKKAGW